MADVFLCGKRSGETYEEGLVDSSDEDDFKLRLEINCRELWVTRESSSLRPGQISFYDYFCKHYSNVVSYNTLKDLRTAAGLGSPRAMFTTTGSESIHAHC